MYLWWCAVINSIFLTGFAAGRPNILFILTDDQDVTQHGMFPLKNVQRQFGVSFSNAFTSSPICCPSRASIFTGLYAHNHGTRNNSLNGGCSSQRWQAEMEPNTLGVLLQNAGYRTFFAGKYLNQYKGEHLPAGWHEFYGLHGNSKYFDYTLRENHANVSYGHQESDYLTDILKNKTGEFLANHFKSFDKNQPFFAMVSVPAAHAPFTPAPRHKNAFAGITAMKTPNYNVVPSSRDKHWLVSNAISRKIPQKTLQLMDSYFQQRWETLLAVDELVANLTELLSALGVINDTYMLFTSDNGYHVGQFAMPFDKRQPYETDIRVPLYLKVPNLNNTGSIAAPVALIDILPTMLEWANVDIPVHLDGLSMQKHIAQLAQNSEVLNTDPSSRSLLIQYWGEGNLETYNPQCPYGRKAMLAQCSLDADCHCQDAWNNTYACLRSFRNENRIYCEFNDKENFVELYDLDEDAFQMTNAIYDVLPIERALYSLRLANLTNCSGLSCKQN